MFSVSGKTERYIQRKFSIQSSRFIQCSIHRDVIIDPINNSYYANLHEINYTNIRG